MCGEQKMQELTQVNYRYTFPSLTVTNIKVPEGLYTHDFRGNKLVLRVDKFGEVRVANETPCNNERKLAQDINKAAHLISGFKVRVASSYQIVELNPEKIKFTNK
jgi:hypothetical protein